MSWRAILALLRQRAFGEAAVDLLAGAEPARPCASAPSTVSTSCLKNLTLHH
jgi:hypothetical protein